MSEAPVHHSRTVLAIVLDGEEVCGVTVRDRSIVAHRVFDPDTDPSEILAALAETADHSPSDPVEVTLTIGGLLTALLSDGSTDAGCRRGADRPPPGQRSEAGSQSPAQGGTTGAQPVQRAGRL